jgi:hypothetical protein
LVVEASWQGWQGFSLLILTSLRIVAFLVFGARWNASRETREMMKASPSENNSRRELRARYLDPNWRQHLPSFLHVARKATPDIGITRHIRQTTPSII